MLRALREVISFSSVLNILTKTVAGIGSAISHNLASKGCSLLLGYVNPSSKKLANDLANELSERYEIKAVSAGSDLGSQEGASSIIEIAKEHFTDAKTTTLQIDIVVNNAGIAKTKPLGNITELDFKEIYSTNVLGPIFLLQACLTHLPKDRSGRIVNVSSVGCGLGLEQQTVYAGSKGALEAMTRVWARELAERATVNAVNPGPVISDILRGCSDEIKVLLGEWNKMSPLAAVTPQDQEVMQEWTKFGGRPAYASEIAGVVGMLCTPDAAWTTGSVVSANGGMKFSS